ncbi:MYB DNA-binding domain-containing protein [Plectosphaerella cucumerina]|uniref:MYB DNA-binding domain-containing protein n=1 Tax=Plectosphaerella cucumerina TaxID=40658 RepID=A0A8K0TCL9_9PEZI|nr:MYB DNA-binding domain-containing protein [Plectosphaerella cucumerina]
MAFIEPRLIHLLNDATTPHLAHTDLPPFAEAFPGTPGRPLHLEPIAGLQDDQLSHQQHGASYSLPGVLDDGLPLRDFQRDADLIPERALLGSAPRIPLRMLLGASGPIATSLPTTRTPEDPPQNTEDTVSKKRQLAIASKDDILHLPQPVKKQKPAPQPLLPSMPPIINGLHEPPPNAALFPPISSNEFDDTEQNTARNTVRDYQTSPVEDKPSEAVAAKPQKSTPGKTRKKAMKPRRKWSEEETKHLLLGVNRHGVGKWTDILADPDFSFNSRTAGDLKDRFRTCCPNELRKKSTDANAAAYDSLPTPPAEPRARARTGLLSENILIEDDHIHITEQPRNNAAESDAGAKTKKSRAHRKKMEDLAELGIHGPFKKSHRRERKPFSEQDDARILEGLAKYGPAWTKIQRDSALSLTGRQPTDLRDRVRNKYPDVYQQIEKGLVPVTVNEGNSTGLTFIPTNMAGVPLPPPAADAHASQAKTREELRRWRLDAGEPSQPFEMGESTHASFLVNTSEMDISRLLQDDNQIAHLPVRQLQGTTSDVLSM